MRDLSIKTGLLVAALLLGGLLQAEPVPVEEDAIAGEVLASYLQATSEQAEVLRDVLMDVEIEATLPRLNKTGRLWGLRHISRIGQITYRAVTFQGDNTIKKDVIGRYITAEAEAAAKPGLSVSEDNYKFKYYGLHGEGDWQLHLFYLSPRKKQPGLFKGWLWVEANTTLPVREQGEFVKSPSVFLKKVEFVRDYLIRDGVAFPMSIISSIDARLVGKAELSVRFSNYVKQEAGDLTRAALSSPAWR